MARNTDRSVSLVVRARDDATSTFERISDALGKVTGAQDGTRASAADLAAALSTVDKSASTINAAADRAASGMEKLGGRIAAQQDKLDELKREAADAARALASLNSPDTIVAAGRDQAPRLQQVAEVTKQQERLRREIARTTEALAAEQGKIDGSRAAMQQLGSIANAAAEAQAKLRAEIDRATAAEERQVSALQRVAEAADRAQRAQAAFAPRPAATTQGAGYEAVAANDMRLDRAADALRASLNPVAAIQTQINAKLREANELFRAEKISAAELTQQTARLNAEMKRATDAGSGKQFSAFGLQPYQLTNLGYQLNDIGTQLASGTSLTQTLGQQAGQIIQIFPRVTTGIIAAFTNPAFLGAAAVVSGITAAVIRLQAETERLRDFSGVLTANGNGLAYQAGDLEKITQRVRQVGIAADDASAALRGFVADGIAADKLEPFLRTSRDLAEVMGTKLPDAAKVLSDGFSGGYDAVVKLDAATHAYTSAELDRIRTLYEAGRADEARSEAFRVFSQRMDAAAEKMRGPWANATRELGGAFQTFFDTLSHTKPIEAVNALLLDAATGVTRLLNLIGGGAMKSRVDMLREISALSIRIREAEQIQARDRSQPRALGIQRLRDQLAALKRDYAAAVPKPDSGDTLASGDTPEKKREAAALRELSLQQQLERARERLDVAEASRLAGLIAAQGVEGDILKAKTGQLAAEKERATLQQKADAAAKSARADREREIQQFNGRVVGAEGGAGRNPFSTASGFGQFTEGTWLEQFRKVFRDEGDKLSRDQILALRGNASVAKAVIDNYARENARFLESFGAKVTAGNLYLSHFLGGAGAKKVLQANGSTPVDRLLDKQVLAGNRGYLFDKGAGRYRTADELEKFIAGRVGDTGQAQSAGVVEIEKLLEQSRRRQDEFNEAVARGNAERERGNDAVMIQNDLIDTALIAAQREATITKALSDLQTRAAEANKNLPAGESAVTVTTEQIARTRELAAAEFDLQNARALAQAQQNEVERPMRGLEAEQQALRARVDLLRDLGDTAGAKAVSGQLDEVNAKLRESIEATIAFYEALDPETDPLHRTREEIDATVTALQNSRDEAADWGTILGESARNVASSLANDLEGALDGFAQRIADGANAFRALKLSFLDFASSFLRTIAQLIQQQIAFNIVRGLLSAVGMGASSAASAGGSWFSQTVGAGFTVAHTGGVIGSSVLPNRQGDMSWLQTAARYHTGGIAGLKPNEVPAILERGEEVLTRADARHRDNGGGTAVTVPAPKIVNLFDAESAAQELLNTRAGEKAVLNIISTNPRALRSLLGG
ncbi:phage tail length tape measure family protein [Sphingomonas phyllosphaerae]|uniref:phage tail length tape measure family protein n=1 Tax=Sphingomonas phyllosphaerae TaxID=257003 RepID=UPI0003B6DE85|nr:phage tail length tape measure family protein [Sphingomonas phyllosphaerae]